MTGSRPYVLVVDDEHDGADSMTMLLALWGYDGEPRYCGMTALAAALTRRPAAVLLDIGMPRMTGFEFVARFRELPGCGHTPVVVVSGHTDVVHRARARELGIDHYLFKPADPSLVRAVLEQLISARQPERRPSTASETTNDTPVGEFPTHRVRGSRRASRCHHLP